MTADTPAQARLPLGLKLFHGLGSVAYGVKDNGFSTFLLIFYSQVVGLDASLVSLALMFALLADAFVDPLIGYFSDRTYTRWGRRHPWLYLAPLPLGLAWMLLWSPPDDHTHIFAYLVVVAVLVTYATCPPGPITPRGPATTWIVCSDCPSRNRVIAPSCATQATPDAGSTDTVIGCSPTAIVARTW